MLLPQLLRLLREKGFTPDSRGGNVWIRCPFHDDATPSLSISVNKPGHPWLCWSTACGQHGKLAGLLQGVLDDGAVSSVPVEAAVPSVYPEAWLEQYRWRHPYLSTRGFPDWFQDARGIGFDKKRARVTFPVRDREGRLAGLIGRSVINEEPRYFYYWHFPKSLTLYNIENVREGEDLIVTEGVTKTLRLVQWGMPSVSILGSRLSEQQAGLLEGLRPRRVLLCLDPDESGIKGVKEARKSLTMPECFVIMTPCQIDEMEPQAFRECHNAAVPWSVWLYKEKENERQSGKHSRVYVRESHSAHAAPCSYGRSGN